MSFSPGFFSNSDFNNFQQEIILQAPIPILILEGLEFIISTINEKNLEMWQKTQEEVLGKPLFEVFPETKEQSFHGALMEVYQTGVGIKCNEEKAEFYRNEVLDTAWFDINYEPIKNQKGEVTAIMVISFEVTAQVSTRKKAEQNEKEFKFITDAIANLVWIADDEGSVDFYNKRVYEYCGLKEHTDKDLLWQTIVHPDDLEKTQENWQNALDTKTLFSIQHRLKDKNGLYRWFLSRAFYEEEVENKMAKWFGSSTDIDEQKQIELKIEDSEIFTRTVLESSPDCLKIIDNDGRIVFMNKNGQCLLEIDDFEEVQNKMWWNLWGDENKEIVKNAVHKALLGETVQFIAPGKTLKGTFKWWDVIVSPVSNSEGGVHEILAVSRNITLQKELEEKTVKARELFEVTLQNLPSAIYHLDKDGKILYLNELAAKQMGYNNIQEVLAVESVYELRDRIEENFIVLDENGKVLAAHESSTSITLKTGKPAEIAVKFISKKDETSFWLLTKSVPLHDEAGELTDVFTSCTDITSQKKSEEALKYRKALLEAQNEAIPDAILIVDEEGNMLSFNKNFAKIWGMPDEIIANKDDNAALTFAMSHVIDPEGFMERVRYCYSHPAVKAHDEILLKDGRILDRYGNAVVGEDGTPYGWAWYFKDITEQKKTELLIKESEEKYRGLFERMDQGFCIVEVIFDSENNPIDYRFLESNPVFKQQTGLDNVNGKTIKEIVPDIEIMWAQRYGQVVMTGEAIRFIDYSQAMNTWFEVYAFRLGDKTHNKVAILFTNITDRKKAEIELKASEARFRSLTETIPQMVWMTDEIGNPEYLSSQWIEYAGEMPIGNYWMAICHPDDIENSLNAWQKSVTTGKKFTSEIRLQNKEQEYRWHVSVGLPLKNDQNEIIKWIGSVTDIHDQKLKEQKKDDFISIASHEMKTPLTSAKAYLELMEMTLDEKHDAYLYTKKAHDAIERLNKLISELLDASKIQHGKLNFTNTVFDFDTMIADTIENVQYSSITHKIIKNGSINKAFLGDKDRLQQVLINLLTNAIKYSPNANEVIVKVIQENNYLQVSVMDKGIGMPEKHLERVFERYYRVEEHSVHFQGLGIGLYISYDIIQRHNGKMWVESVSGEGSSFHFILPFID